MKQIKPSEIPQTIAELLEPKPKLSASKMNWTDVQDFHVKSCVTYADILTPLMCWKSDVRGDWQPLDFEHDPRGTDMLWKWMMREQDFESAVRRIHETSDRYDMRSVEDWNALVARAFLWANQFEVIE